MQHEQDSRVAFKEHELEPVRFSFEGHHVLSAPLYGAVIEPVSENEQSPEPLQQADNKLGTFIEEDLTTID